MERKDYRLAAILYTDIAGFSKMMEKNEALTLELLAEHNRIVEEVVRAKGGTVIKTIGDAFLIDFKNTVDALQSAIEVQYRLYDYNKLHPDLPLLVRIGAHLGDIYFYENDALGEGINIAARLQSIAHPGCICMSGDVYNHVINKVDFKAEKLGRVSLKNISKEIHAYEIATPNVEFDPNAASRTILVPDKEEKAAAPAAAAPSAAPAASPDVADKAPELKRRILLDIKAAGRRLGADQMLIRYGAEGPAAEAVIRDMAAKGLLLREAERPATPASKEEFVHAVSDLEYRIEDEIRRGLESAFSARRGRRGRDAERRPEPPAPPAKGGRWDRKLAESSFKTKADSLDDYQEYAARVRREARSAGGGFLAHLIPFVAVNAGLMALNAAVSPSFPWAIFPFGGWAIGLLEHFAAMLRKGERAKELEKLPPLDAESLSLFKELQKKKDSIWLHLASTFSTTAFLWAVNLIVSPQFLWFLFPAAGMGIGLFVHAASYSAKKAALRGELRDRLGIRGARGAKSGLPERDFGQYGHFVQEARAIEAALKALAPRSEGPKKGRAAGGAFAVDDDLLETVDSYVGQVALLAERTAEADRIIDLIPMEALKSDKARLLSKMEAGGTAGLRKEYEKSLAEIGKQESSHEELKEQREVLELRLRSSVNTLKQLRIDLARLAGADDENASVNALRDKTQELNRYLSDLRAGYDEIDAMESRVPKK